MKFWLRRGGILLALFGIAALATWHNQAWWWVEVHTGTVNEPGPYYGFFSGFGSDLSELALLAGIGGLLRRYNCEVHGCWRIGRHTTEAGHHVCRVHHPDGRLTAEAVRQAHHLHLRRREHLARQGTAGDG